LDIRVKTLFGAAAVTMMRADMVFERLPASLNETNT
jgi:hypothetical protein